MSVVRLLDPPVSRGDVLEEQSLLDQHRGRHVSWPLGANLLLTEQSKI